MERVVIVLAVLVAGCGNSPPFDAAAYYACVGTACSPTCAARGLSCEADAGVECVPLGRLCRTDSDCCLTPPPPKYGSDLSKEHDFCQAAGQHPQGVQVPTTCCRAANAPCTSNSDCCTGTCTPWTKSDPVGHCQ